MMSFGNVFENNVSQNKKYRYLLRAKPIREWVSMSPVDTSPSLNHHQSQPCFFIIAFRIDEVGIVMMLVVSTMGDDIRPNKKADQAVSHTTDDDEQHEED